MSCFSTIVGIFFVTISYINNIILFVLFAFAFEFLRFLVNDRICVFRNTHIFGYINLDFSWKYYLNRMLFVYVYWYNKKKLVHRNYFKIIFTIYTSIKMLFTFFQILTSPNTWNFRLYTTNLHYTHFPTSLGTDSIHVHFSNIHWVFPKQILILLWYIQQNKVKCNFYNNNKLYRNN